MLKWLYMGKFTKDLKAEAHYLARLLRFILANLKTAPGRKKLLELFVRTLDYVAVAIIKGISYFFNSMFNPKTRGPMIKNVLLFVLAMGVFFAGVILLWVVTLKIPDVQSFDQRLISQSTKIYDQTGNILLYDLGKEVRRTAVPFDQISQNLKNATIAIEDKDFYKHKGIQPSSIFRAIIADIMTLRLSQGGSTITQQVVKNALLTTDKRISRKIKEWVLAIKLEKAMDKDTILSLYLNNSPYGGTLYGSEEASLVFFGKHVSDLTIAEAAYLAALPQAPTYYSPFGKHKDALENRKNLVLSKMKEYGYISDDEYKLAVAEKVAFQTQVSSGLKAPHFVMFVKEYLEEKYGEDMVDRGGLKVISTLDYELELKAEQHAKKYGIENAINNNAENLALVAIDPTNGQIRAMVGSRDYFDKQIQGNFNVATAHRQPGSAFKPIVYANAFTMGYTPDTILFDVKTEFNTSCTPDGTPKVRGANCYSPENYDGIFEGPMTLRSALAESRNIPAIKLLYLAGIRDSINLAKEMGITSLTTPDQYGLTLVLGGGEVSLLELTSAYGTFATSGYRNPYTAVLKVEDREGNILEEFSTSTKEVLPEQTARQINDILSDNAARAPAFGTNSPLNFPGRSVAVKTGTTNNYRDAWVIGYTPHIVVGAWAGNNDNSPMAKRISRYLIVPFWNAVMKDALAKVPVETFPSPEPVDQNIKPILRGVWQGDIHSILYFVDKNNPNGPYPSNPWADGQFGLWEPSVRAWAAANGYLATSTPPTDTPPDPNGSTTTPPVINATGTNPF
jgi:1A family penicillin-binding protein